jgi:pyridoxine/pyridoxamine 5'-phosphate oxidase
LTSEPKATRPGFSEGYGISEEPEGMLPWSWAVERLTGSRNYWIVTADADGRPRSMPVWGIWLDDSVVFGTNAGSRKGKNLARDPRVVIHPDSGDEVVILEGSVEEITLDAQIAGAFQEKYDWRPDPAESEGSAWLRLRPSTAFAWLERDYPRTATRFLFEAR